MQHLSHIMILALLLVMKTYCSFNVGIVSQVPVTNLSVGITHIREWLRGGGRLMPKTMCPGADDVTGGAIFYLHIIWHQLDPSRTMG